MRNWIALEQFEEVAQRWQCGQARIWMYHGSLRRLAVRVASETESEVLYLLASGCEHITGPFSWRNERFSIFENADPDHHDTRFRLEDQSAGFMLRCGAVAATHRPANEVYSSFEQFFDDESQLDPQEVVRIESSEGDE